MSNDPHEDGVVIAGGGLAAQRVAETLRRVGYEGRIRMVSAERHLPYDRPPLSKEVLGDEGAEAQVGFRAPEWYAEKDVEVLLGAAASGLDGTRRRLALADGRVLGYDDLVIATGATPRMLPQFAPFANVSTLRTLEDSRLLREHLGSGGHLLVIGAGFIGLEVAAAARAAGADVTLVELERLPLLALLGEDLGRWFADLHAAAGVELLLGRTVAEIHGDGAIEAVTLDDGRRLATAHVLVGIGVRPDLGWLAGSGLPMDGIPADPGGRTSLPNVYAAGDAAAWFDPYLGRHRLSGHWEAAGRQGAAVAHTIVGRDPAPAAISSFWSDQYGTRVQYLGHAPLADRVSIEGDPAARDFVAHFERDGELVAAVAVGRPKALPELRDRLSHLTERTAT
jgi:3-phenylpropionate/trans-cinnamate dioxygenase ferredoxin reductase subunit